MLARDQIPKHATFEYPELLTEIWRKVQYNQSNTCFNAEKNKLLEISNMYKQKLLLDIGRLVDLMEE